MRSHCGAAHPSYALARAASSAPRLCLPEGIPEWYARSNHGPLHGLNAEGRSSLSQFQEGRSRPSHRIVASISMARSLAQGNDFANNLRTRIQPNRQESRRRASCYSAAPCLAGLLLGVAIPRVHSESLKCWRGGLYIGGQVRAIRQAGELALKWGSGDG